MRNEIFKYKTIAEYLLVEDKTLIDIVLQNVAPKKVISISYQGNYYYLKPRVNDLFQLEYKWIIKIKQSLQINTLNSVKEIVSAVFPIHTDIQFFNCSVFDVFAAYAWIIEEMEAIAEAEKEKLYKKPTQKQINAGIEEFDQLDDIPAIDGLANGDMEKWDAVLEQPYGKVMRKMLLSRIQSEYDEQYMKAK